ncbi:hypothetical protein CesoFtcFv8_008306 [Champsocephalus esox]|uniref:Uncharacterized protein n=1 Tax=Champsocephalus esox TaxID=159716 RepID=A0AAN8C898_9TELE|nr:hypothetical protein CesoFtcFv8_008306 [Champsocephalus esox]
MVASQLGLLPGVGVGMETPRDRPRSQWGGQDVVGDQNMNTAAHKINKNTVRKAYGSPVQSGAGGSSS